MGKGKQPKRATRPPRDLRESVATFCGRCYALRYTTGQCPACDLQKTDYNKFCRRCLNVHSVRTTCRAWSPPVQPSAAEAN